MDESTNSQLSSVPSNDNVIPFPTRVVASISEPEKTPEERGREFVDEMTRSIAVELLAELHGSFDIQSTTFDKNFGFAMEALRSAMLATLEIPHPFQDIVDKCVIIPYDNDDFEPDPA